MHDIADSGVAADELRQFVERFGLRPGGIKHIVDRARKAGDPRAEQRPTANA